MFWPIFGLIESFLGQKWLFLANFDPILPYMKVKGFWEIFGFSSQYPSLRLRS